MGENGNRLCRYHRRSKSRYFTKQYTTKSACINKKSVAENFTSTLCCDKCYKQSRKTRSSAQSEQNQINESDLPCCSKSKPTLARKSSTANPMIRTTCFASFRVYLAENDLVDILLVMSFIR